MTAAALRPARRLVWTALAHLKRCLYPDGRPAPLTRALNALVARQHALGILTTRGSVTLVVPARHCGRPVSVPLVMASVGGAPFLVSMLGERADWVRNVRAAGGRAVLLQHRRRMRVHLVEVPPEDRAPVLRAYLAVAPAARPHIAVDRHAPLAELARVAADHPVFRVHRNG